ncbi:heparinase II/III domain-containing protein [Sediminibacterium ginsengisoli]|uniref:Heparinase II/III-like protein n=1 Tax=Sediminibacterium ginsengisoli TaxID=413434 RepID=A0A1T4QJA3_9BACT|nr:heparinase II/III family protein [Sediminibacterium ginsengisoli]SKA03863.1 Heparinase II/III-like protein [Sediminibacterium ginsengisoli]
MKYLICLLLVLQSFHGNTQSKRNLLTGRYTEADLASQLVKGFGWVGYPAYTDRAKWNSLPAAYRKELLQKGEKALDYKWQLIPATAYLEYTRSGNRNIMQDPYGQNTNALKNLLLAELTEGKGRFTDQIANGCWAICEMTSWSLSAHLSLQKAGLGLPDVKEPIIDLGVGNTALLLAWTHYFLKDRLDSLNPLISQRIRSEIRRQVLEPYYQRNDFWWMALEKDEFVNNWNVWVNYNVLNCILLIENDPQKKISGIYKTMRSVDKFINYYKDDGACEEGPAYWSEAGAKLYLYLGLLERLSGGKIHHFDNPLIHNMAAYIYKAYITGDYYINFADASAKLKPEAGLIYQFGKAVKDSMMVQFGSLLARNQGWKETLPAAPVDLALADLFDVEEIVNGKAAEPLIRSAWMPGTEIVAVRERAGSSAGFYLAAKGGHNAESHNHNDVGTCIVFYNAQPLLIDIGSETYTRQTFGAERYTRWGMRSAYHNVPLINGVEQRQGAAFKSKNASFTDNVRNAVFSVDIAGAYPADAAVKSWVRSYHIQENGPFTITDNYELSSNNGKTALHFMTSNKTVRVKDGILQLELPGGKLNLNYDAGQLEAQVEPITVTDPRLLKSWPKDLYRIIFTFKNKQLKGKNILTFTKPTE